MRYHFEQTRFYPPQYGETYICNHPVYRRCTLYRIGKLGLAVIQQRFDEKAKATYWSEIDPWIVDDIYLSPGFRDFFMSRASLPSNGLYPTVSVRQIMWALRMKPIKRERWETVFDRKLI